MSQKGFIPDVMSILLKYDLSHFINIYMSDGIFPDKRTWKNCIKNAILKYEGEQIRHNVQVDAELSRYRAICEFSFNEDVYAVPSEHWIWGLIRKYGDVSIQLSFIVSLCTVKTTINSDECSKCGNVYDDILVHMITSCPVHDAAREVFWNILVNELSVQSSVYLT
jgi:hypothetical protein